MIADARTRATVASLEALVREALVAAGAADGDSVRVAHEVVDAEARGYEAQGLIRVPSYIGWMRDGAIVSPTILRELHSQPSAVAWDAGDGWGHVAAWEAMEECVARANQTGACFGVIRNVGHIGRLGYYVEHAAEMGAIGFIACSGNPASATMAPWGGREPRLSTNPFAFGFPYPGGDNVVIDISTTQAARGKILVAQATGSSIPSDWAFDTEGEPTTDPHRALPPNGTLAPTGGHKGYALAIAVELLCGGLAGVYPPPDSGVFIAAFAPTAVTEDGQYSSAVRAVDELMSSGAPRPGFSQARLPGAGSAARLRAARESGVQIAPQLWEAVREALATVGVSAPSDPAALSGK